jgi:hypothetical protein
MTNNMVNIAHLGQSMKKEQIVPRLKSFPRTTFSTWQIFIGLYYIFQAIFKININFESKYDI